MSEMMIWDEAGVITTKEHKKKMKEYARKEELEIIKLFKTIRGLKK